jgi:hypothetical protein
MRCYYEVVTSNGHGIHARVHGPLAEAQARAQRLAAAALIDFGPFELQQVVEYSGGGRRYWMREGGRWVPWQWDRDFELRKPDWLWPSASATSETEN